jgi:hypothetical protein
MSATIMELGSACKWLLEMFLVFHLAKLTVASQVGSLHSSEMGPWVGRIISTTVQECWSFWSFWSHLVCSVNV